MIDIRVSGDDKVVVNLKNMGPQIVNAGTASVKRSTMKVLRLAKLKVSGDVLKNRTGTLRRAINSRIEGNNWQVVGIVGIKLAYGRAHEMGFHGTVTVREHMRRTKASTKAAAGIGWRGKSRNAVARSQGLGAGIVRAHTMRMNIPERSFLRSSLRDLRGDIIADLKASVAKAVKE